MFSTSSSKKKSWELTDGQKIESEHPPLRNVKIQLSGKQIELNPVKIVQDNDTHNIKNIVLQNNFTNTHLHTIGNQLTKIENLIKHPVTTAASSSFSKIQETKKLPVFKPYQITKASQIEL